MPGDSNADFAGANCAPRCLKTCYSPGFDVEARHFALLDYVNAQSARGSRVSPSAILAMGSEPLIVTKISDNPFVTVTKMHAGERGKIRVVLLRGSIFPNQCH